MVTNIPKLYTTMLVSGLNTNNNKFVFKYYQVRPLDSSPAYRRQEKWGERNMIKGINGDLISQVQSTTGMSFFFSGATPNNAQASGFKNDC